MLSASKSGSGLSTGYNLTRSLRFRSAASATLTRTPASATNRQTFTWSGWVKRGTLTTDNGFFSAYTTGANQETSFLFAADALRLTDNISGVSSNWNLTTTAVYRDPSSWYHIVIAIDTTQATSTNRVKLYVNGTQITSFSSATYPTQNFNCAVNNTVTQAFGSRQASAYLDGYLAEVNFIDGQALTPSSFGSTNALTGVWQPARYTGTYGTNGFYLPFTDNSALTTSSNVGLGKDFSGNGNYWTTNNISITAGTTYDSMTDVPTLTSATAANFAVLNVLNTETGMTGTLSDGNLTLSSGGGKRSTIAARTGKYYWEFVSNSGAGANFPMSGLYVAGLGTYYPGYDANSFGYYQGGSIYYNGTVLLTVSAYTDGDIIGFAWDADTGKVYVSKNNTWQNSGNPAAGTGQVATISTGVDRVVGAYNSSGSCSINFGQRPFTYTPPTGFVALNTFNLPTSTILAGNKVMDATLYTGTGASLSVTNAGAFKPDLVWVKSRSAATDHKLTDSVRGATKGLVSDSTAAETTDTNGLTAFNSNGWTLGTDTTYNNSGATYVGWQWQAGQGSTSSNTNGSITSTVSVNASAGFSVVTWTGTGANATIGHGLGVAPSMMIVKNRTTASTDWPVYFISIGATNWLALDLTIASSVNSGMWNNTTPTSSVFSVGTSLYTNASANNYVAYCWTPIAGYSAFGSYTGNGSTDGTFVYTGFRPKFVMWKNITDYGSPYPYASWGIIDATAMPYNANAQGTQLWANNSAAQGYRGNGSSVDTEPGNIDLLSNGFKFRTTYIEDNAASTNYIYIAFAANPFKNSLAR